MQTNAYPCLVPKPGNPLQPLVLARFFLCFRLDLLQHLFDGNVFEAETLVFLINFHPMGAASISPMSLPVSACRCSTARRIKSKDEDWDLQVSSDESGRRPVAFCKHSESIC